MQSEPVGLVVGALRRAVLGRAGRRPTTARARSFPALQQFHYSNLGYALLGEVAARLLGSHLVGVRADRGSSTPLGMTPHVVPPRRARPRRATACTLRRHPGRRARRPTPARWRRPARCGRRSATSRRTPPSCSTGHPDVLSVEELRPASHPQSGDREDALELRARAGLPALARAARARSSATPARCPASSAAVLVDRKRRTGARGARQRDHRLLAGRARHRAARRARALRADPARAVAAVGGRAGRAGGRPGRVALGQHAVRVRDGGRASWSRARTGSRAYRFEVRDGRVRRRRPATTPARSCTSYAAPTGRSATSTSRRSSTRGRRTTRTPRSRGTSRVRVSRGCRC